ncbi:MAG TPA: response regulator [Candidatus Nitrosotenuis sp.]|jgi:two-component system alkaline phosphatase synthesis response regulator PhoP/two-component system response regulator VicR|nr:response regulator [Candidatus Nitrosotenuis sp.]
MSTKGKAKVLAVDDKKNIVRLIQVNLEKAGYEVTPAYNGAEALRRVQMEKPDLIILDVMMPAKDGFETLKELKEDPNTRDIPVIMLTAKAQDADVFKGWQSGCDCYLTKPFNPSELLMYVDRILGFKSETSDKAPDGGQYYEI